MAYVRVHGNRIQIRFRVEGIERTVSIPGPPTAANLRKAESLGRHGERRLRVGDDWASIRDEIRGEHRPAGTVGHYAQHLLDHAQVERSTLIQYQNTYNRVWSAFDGWDARRLKRSDIERTLAGLNTGKDQRNAASVIRQVLQVAVNDDDLPDNPAKGLRFKKHQKTEKTPYTREERDALLSHLNGHYRTFFALAFATGMRTGELLALQPRHLHKPMIRVEQVMAAGEIVPRTKTHRPRDVYVPEEIWSLLEPLRFQTWLFQWQGNPYHHGNRLMEHLSRAHKRSGVERRTGPYPWRMSYISWLLADGVRPDLVCQQTGHDIKTMLTHYAQFIPREDDAPTIERAWKGSR